MINNKSIFKTEDRKNTFLIVLLYCVWTKFFNFVGITSPYYGTILSIILFIASLILLPQILKKTHDNISKSVKQLCIWFGISILWCYLIWGQSFYDSIRVYFAPNSGVFPIILYFWLKKDHVTLHTMVRSITIITIIYSICYIIGLITVPYPIFGASSQDMAETYEAVFEQRGVVRLYMQGADFIVLSIMLILTRYENKKKYYWFLLPLFIMLVLRGTRTPFFVATLISAAYLLFKIKYKIVSILLTAAIAISIPTLQNAALESNSDNPIIKYIQITNSQLDENNDENDIRVEMSEYMFTKFNNGKVLPILFGNGIPNGGRYGAKMQQLQENNYYFVVDVGFTNIFIYFGIVGLILYLMLLMAIIKTRVSRDYFFAKLYMIYLYLILPTNCALISLSAVMVALSLYVIYLGRDLGRDNISLRKIK